MLSSLGGRECRPSRVALLEAQYAVCNIYLLHTYTGLLIIYNLRPEEQYGQRDQLAGAMLLPERTGNLDGSALR